MKLSAAQLLTALKKPPLPALLWLSGDDPLLTIEAADAVRAGAGALGFSERVVIEADAKFNGAELIAESQSMSLFGERKLIELRLQAKLNDRARKSLLEYVNSASLDNLLLIISSRLEASTAKAKWFNQLIQTGWWVPIWPVEAKQFPQWINHRIRQAGLTADKAAIGLLAERNDGNLLAAAQEIEKLGLLSNQTHLTAEAIMASVADSSRYGLFDLSAAFLQGDVTRTLKIIHALEADGTEPVIVLWLIGRELRYLVELAEAKRQRQALAVVFKRLRILEKSKAAYLKALSRASAADFIAYLARCGSIDAAIKSSGLNDAWLMIEKLLLIVAQPSFAEVDGSVGSYQ